MLRLKRILVLPFLLAFIASTAQGQDQIPWITDLRQARQMAEQQQRVVLLHFWSDSCPPCRQLEQNVFNQPEVIRLISAGFIPVKINTTQQPKYADFYKVDRVPMDILVDHTGKELYRTTSPQKIDDYVSMLAQVRAQVGISAGRTLEAMAQNPLQKFASALPPMAGSPEEQPSSEPINSDPQADGAASPPWQTAPLADRAKMDLLPQATRVQNQFAAAGSQIAARASEVSSRSENPYVQGGDPAQQVATPGQTATAARPWETANSATNAASAVSNFGARAPESAPVAPPNMPANMAPSTSMAFAPGQPPAGAPAQNGGMVLPNNVPPLALEGYCPVTLVGQSKWVKGDPRFGAIHRGRTYLLATQADQQRFLSEPDRFSPALSGYDPVRFTEGGQLVDGKREHGLFLPNSGYYLFADEASLARFESQPHGYVNAVRQAMANSRPGPR